MLASDQSAVYVLDGVPTVQPGWTWQKVQLRPGEEASRRLNSSTTSPTVVLSWSVGSDPRSGASRCGRFCTRARSSTPITASRRRPPVAASVVWRASGVGDWAARGKDRAGADGARRRMCTGPRQRLSLGPDQEELEDRLLIAGKGRRDSRL